MALSFTHVVNLGFFFLAYPNVLLLILNVCLERSVSVEFSSNRSQILRTLSPSPLCLNWSWVHSISGLVMSTTATAHACVAPTPAAADPIPRPLPSSREPRTTMPCPCRLPPVQGLSYSSTATQRPATDASDHAHPHAVTTTAPHQWRQSGFVQKQKRIMSLVSWEEKRPKSWSVTTTAPHQWRQSGFVQKQKRIMSLVSTF
jgi:uncharacterized protein YqcC (DUF446 family)